MNLCASIKVPWVAAMATQETQLALQFLKQNNIPAGNACGVLNCWVEAVNCSEHWKV